MMWVYLALLLSLGVGGDYTEQWAEGAGTDQWEVHVEGGKEAAEEVAAAHNMDNLGEVLPDSGIFHLQHRHKAKRSASHHPSNIGQHYKVRKAQQLSKLTRAKREDNIRDQRDNIRDQRDNFRDQRGNLRDQRGNLRDQRGNFRDQRDNFQDQRQDNIREQRDNLRDQMENNIREKREDIHDQRDNFRDQRDNFQDQRQDNIRDQRDNFRDQRGNIRDQRDNIREQRDNLRDQRENNIREKREDFHDQRDNFRDQRDNFRDQREDNLHDQRDNIRDQRDNIRDQRDHIRDQREDNIRDQRVNFRDQREDNIREKREDNVREHCFVSTIATSSKPSGRCVFPFVYKSVLYQRCTSDHSSNDQQWCATMVGRDGTAVKGEWGDCDFDNIQCRKVAVADPDASSSPSSSIPVLPVRPHVEDPSNSIEEMLSKLAEELRPTKQPEPQKSKSAAPKLPMGAHRLPPSLDDFLLLLGPRGPAFPPPRRTPIVQDGVEVEEGVTRESMARFTDKEWPRQWYLNRGGDIDMNVEEAWNLGFSGRGVTVTILDDGVEWNHPDLSNNYDKDASYDINGNDRDPFPRYDLFDTNKHGTRCAGQVAAVANNSLCSVGVAYQAAIGGVRMLDGTITDAVEARSLSLNPQHIDIYSASWGPDDDGRTVDGPGPLTRRALEEGTKRGRGGKGSIFVWASGNGGKFHDNCNCDGYATSIFTLSVSSASENGVIPWYSEQCSSTLATTYSSGSSRRGERKVITTDLHGRCTSSHTGTSASSPMAAAMVALVLEANPSLTWRDIQHIVVRTAKVANLRAEDWAVNGAGFNVSHAFGFGLMDAGEMVKMALKWEEVPEQARCKVEWNENESRITPRNEATLTLDVDGCGDVQVLEHVHVVVDMSSRSRRGDFSLRLKSAAGTESVLLAPRPLDNSISGFANFRTWPLMSTHYWGENPRGKWSLVVRNDGTRDARLMGWQIIFYGTKTPHNVQIN